MTTNITITEQSGSARSHGSPDAAPMQRRKLPGWLWFIALWCFGVASAMSLGFVFKLLMNATLFAVK
ncbi:hypothetical protein [Paraburkholderia ginsengisoli]|uniref:DUF2474 domain-containing protein n=1 Tax=Paraburkholderia ginsengisoli TaxID=311231 RepID=A0A7T4N9Q4_9BURK|nr:hypothetical protein [Paraburkholderia ginsengisoli]QQC67841.1 hypothetical protein I6I06_21035 [Paraburkholderia ginsengisoli]